MSLSFQLQGQHSLALTEILAIAGWGIICFHGEQQHLEERKAETGHLISSEQISKFCP